MPPRVGPKGAVIKSSSSTKCQRTARPRSSNVIDLTRNSTGETSENSPEEASANEEGSESPEDAPKGYGKRLDGGRRQQRSGASPQGRTLGAHRRPKSNERGAVPRHIQKYVLEDNYIVTSLHHRPWGAGDDDSTIGVYFTEDKAKVAAEVHFQQIKQGADGWESEWRRPDDGMLQLRGRIEEGEDDSETYKASIKRVEQKRPINVQPWAPSVAQPKLRVVKPTHVYMVKEERTINVEAVDIPRRFQNSPGDLIKAREIHGIYMDLDAANTSARKVYDTNLEDLAGLEDATTKIVKNGMVMISVDSKEHMLKYSIRVGKWPLK